MKRVISLASLAGGGLVATAILQAAVAAADVPSADGTDAFTIGGYTFDPFNYGYVNGDLAEIEGFTPVTQFVSAPPFFQLGGGEISGEYPAGQHFDVYNASGTELGSITGGQTVTNLFGMPNTEFTVLGGTPATGETAADLPATGTVYDEYNFGSGYYNVYTATPGTDGTVTDTLVTPYGDQNLSSLFSGINDANPLQPGAAFSGLLGNTSAGDSNAFAIGGLTLDPTGSTSGGVDGFSPVGSLASAPPAADIGGGHIGFYSYPQSFTVYDGTATGSTDIGTINAGQDVTNLFGYTNTELIVSSSSAASGDTTAQAAALPANGTVYDAVNFGNGIENVYTATPGADGTVTDTLVTPYGDENLSSLFSGINAANPLQPGDAFSGLQSGDSAIGADAFTIGSTTFDPFTTSGEGFSTVNQVFGAPPLLDFGGGTPTEFFGVVPQATQSFDIYSGTGSSAVDIGVVHSNEDVTNLLGMTNTEFTVTSSTAATGDTTAQAAALPASGTVYDAYNFGNGFENVYTAAPGADGTVTDTLVTPFGDYDLSSLVSSVDAALPLDPGAAFDLGSSAATAADPLSFLGL